MTKAKPLSRWRTNTDRSRIPVSLRIRGDRIRNVLCQDGKKRTVIKRGDNSWFVQVMDHYVVVTVTGYISADNMFIATGKNASKIKVLDNKAA